MQRGALQAVLGRVSPPHDPVMSIRICHWLISRLRAVGRTSGALPSDWALRTSAALILMMQTTAHSAPSLMLAYEYH